MSETDKTRQKLVESMRKSRKTAEEGSAPGAGTSAPAAKPRSRAAAKKPAAAGARKSGGGRGAAPAAQTTADPYQARPRVWPD
ncbi:MAG: hypothetical protein JSW10_09660 [Pseudomonadota bacterium]|nr:MAG: hypothetical protein JSW10_09660 [Pseudomonadota bacterium]